MSHSPFGVMKIKDTLPFRTVVRNVIANTVVIVMRDSRRPYNLIRGLRASGVIAGCVGCWLPAFRDKISVPPSGVKQDQKTSLLLLGACRLY